jgi:K+-sensing histidine kinase KdpD
MTTALAIELTSEISRENTLPAIAHEIRQPLSAIESIAYYLTLILPGDDPKHREQLTRIQQLVEQSNWILTNGLGLTGSRRPAPQTVDLGELITQTISARPPSLDPPVNCKLAARLPLAHLDPGFGRALIENILGLFRQVATRAHPVQLQTSAVSNGVAVDVSTSAPGYRSIANLPPGSALSLDCAQRMAAMHGGSCCCTIDPASGIRVRVMLP